MIVDNVCKVVEDQAAVLLVMPLLDPLVKRAVEQISYSEADSVAEKANISGRLWSAARLRSLQCERH